MDLAYRSRSRYISVNFCPNRNRAPRVGFFFNASELAAKDRFVMQYLNFLNHTLPTTEDPYLGET